MKKVLVSLAAVFFAYSAPVLADAPDMQSVIDKLVKLDIGVADVQEIQRDKESPLPNSYKEHWQFTIPSVAPKGGQLFTCSKAKYCDAIYDYYDALSFLAGPYLYKSSNGLVVAQLNSGLSVEEAEAIENALLEIK